ncbi:TPA: hypothetical protein ACYLN4_001165 [Burkholderia lata]
MPMVDVAAQLHLSDREIAALTYLIPAIGGAFALRLLSGRFSVFALATFAGTFTHEFLHLVVGAMTGAKPVSMDLFPQRGPTGRMVMGSVTFTNLRWFNALPACIAPILGLPLVGLVAWIRVQHGWSFAETSGTDLIRWALLAPQFGACWPSPTDWRLTLISWPLYLAAGAAVWFFWIAHP